MTARPPGLHGMVTATWKTYTSCTATTSPCARPRVAVLAACGSTHKFASSSSDVPSWVVQRRSFHSTASTSASAGPSTSRDIDTDQYTVSRPPIPNEAKTPRAATAASREASADGEAGSDDVVPPPTSHQTLSLIFSYTTPPPPSAISAFGHRIGLKIPTHFGRPLADDLKLLERCLVHESFWTAVRSLPPNDPNQPRRYTNYLDSRLVDSTPNAPVFSHNGSLATLGNALLGTLTSELLLSSFPNLPTKVTKAALTMYVGPKSLAAVAGSWGVSPSRLDRREVGREHHKRLSRKDAAYGHLVGGVGPGRKKVNEQEAAGGIGLLRWNRQPTTPAYDTVLFEDALASVSRAIVGAVYEKCGFRAARSFVQAQFLARLVPPSRLASPTATSDILPLLKFTNPNRVLSLTLVKHGLPQATHRLLKESGRLTSHPTFLSGVFSGDEKLGEGFGSSIKMSEYRASEDALRRLYVGGKDPSQVTLPSDSWAGISKPGQFAGFNLGHMEVDQESSSS